MANRTMIAALGLLAFGGHAMAQDAGGVRLAPGLHGGPVGLARPLPFTQPPLLTAQFVETVHVAEFTFVVHPEPPSAGAEPLSPEIVSLPLIVIV